MMTLICRVCGRQKETAHNWIEKDEEECACGAVNHYRRPEEPAVEYALSRNDYLLLRSFRIDPE